MDWAIIAQIDRSEAFAPIAKFESQVLYSTSIIVLIVTGIAAFFFHQFVRPIRKLMAGFKKVGAGQTDTKVIVKAKDEFRSMAHSFNEMVDNLHHQRQLVAQREKENEKLLLSILPEPVANRLKDGEEEIADSFPNVTVLFADLSGFTELADTLSANETVSFLNDLVIAFDGERGSWLRSISNHRVDEAAEVLGVEKVKTIGSGYMAVSGLSFPRIDHSKRVVDFALEIIRILRNFNRDRNMNLTIRNAILSKEIIRNYHLPQKLHVEPVDIGFSYDDPPNKVKRVLKEAALATKGVLKKPEPVIFTITYNDSSIDYRVRLFLADYDKVPQIRDEFITRIWYTANRNNLNIPFPIRTVYHQPLVKDREAERLQKFVQYLKTFPSFIYLEDDDLEKLVQDASLKYFGTGEITIDRETIQRNIYIIIAGVAKISVLNNYGKETEITRISRGEFFGEMSLVSSNSGSTSVIAIEDLEVLVLKTETVQDILDNVPRLSREIGEVIETRRRAIRMAKKESN